MLTLVSSNNMSNNERIDRRNLRKNRCKESQPVCECVELRARGKENVIGQNVTYIGYDYEESPCIQWAFGAPQL